MNALERWIEEHFVGELGHEADVMNRLQDHGIISDLCVWAMDVCDTDAERAVQWLDGTLVD